MRTDAVALNPPDTPRTRLRFRPADGGPLLNSSSFDSTHSRPNLSPRDSIRESLIDHGIPSRFRSSVQRSVRPASGSRGDTTRWNSGMRSTRPFAATRAPSTLETRVTYGRYRAGGPGAIGRRTGCRGRGRFVRALSPCDAEESRGWTGCRLRIRKIAPGPGDGNAFEVAASVSKRSTIHLRTR